MKTPLAFRLRKDATTYYYISGSTVTTSSTHVDLEGSVVDWDNLQIQFIRHKNFLGVMRKYMPDTCRFTEDAARILRYVHNTQGYSEAECQLEVMKLNTADQLYYQLAVMDIDFSEYSNMEHYVDVALMEGGISALLNAYDSNTYSLEIGEPQAAIGATPTGPIGPPVDIYMDGLPFIETYNYQTIGSDAIMLVVGQNDFTLGLNYIDRENKYFNTQDSISFGDAKSSPSNTQTITDTEFFRSLMATNVGELQITLNIASITSGSVNTPERLRIRLWAYDDAGTILSQTLVYISPLMSASTTISPGIVTQTITNSFPPKTRLTLFIDKVNSIGNVMTIILAPNPTDVRLTYNIKAQDSLVAAYSQWQVLQMLVANLINTNPIPSGVQFPLTMPVYSAISSIPVKSDLLTTSASVWDVDPTLTYYTSSNAIKNLQYNTKNVTGIGPSPKAYLKMSMKDYVQDGFVSNCAGLGIENIGGVDKIVFEHLSHFFQAGVLIADLGDQIADFKLINYKDHLATNVKVGYKDNTYGDANGEWEFNNELSFTTPVKRNQLDISMTNPFRADPYGMEWERFSVDGQDTNNNGDSDVYKLQTNGVDAGIVAGYGFVNPPYNTLPSLTPLPALQLKRDNGVTGGLPQIGVGFGVGYLAYNIPLTPKRQVKRMLPFLKSVYYNIPNAAMVFQKCKRVMNLQTSIIGGAGAVDEQSDQSLLSTGGDILFKPVIFSFKTPSPIDLAALMTTNPYGVFGFTYKGVYLEGFVMECGVNPGEENSYNFQLLCSPNTVIPDDL